MDFITELLESKDYKNIVVIIDRLSKGVVANRLNNLKANTVVK
jgi:hypothetical protein